MSRVLNTVMQAIEQSMTEAERLEAGPKIWAFMQELEAMEEDFKLLKKEKRSAIDVKKGELKLMVSQYDNGIRQIQVMVDEVLDGTKVKRIRQDTGEVLGEREPSLEELQGSMFSKSAN